MTNRLIPITSATALPGALPGDVWAFPGLIDCHVHFREPGYEYKATMASEATAAKAGGVLTVCEMPNTNPPTVTIAALADKVRRASNIADCRMKFFFGVTAEEHLRTLIELWASGTDELQRLKLHCSGVKLYFDHSTGNQKVQEGLLDEIFSACAQYGIPIVAHCEDAATNASASSALTRSTVDAHSDARPAKAEAVAIEQGIDLARKHGAAFHIAHLSTAEGATLVADAKKDGLPVTCEASPHHLFLTVADYGMLGTKAKMNPPLRSQEHRDALWAGILSGTIDCIATDHAPHTLDEKTSGAPLSAPSGVPGVETMLPLLLSVAQGHWPHPESAAPEILACNDAGKTSAFTPSHIVRACFDAPNRIFHLGASAEPRVTVDPTAVWTLQGEKLHSLCKWTPFEGWRVHGKVTQTAAA